MVLTGSVSVANSITQDILMHGVIVLTSDRRFDAGVFVRSGIVTDIGQNLEADQTIRRVDATGLLVLPGGVDRRMPPRGNWVDDYHTV